MLPLATPLYRMDVLMLTIYKSIQLLIMITNKQIKSNILINGSKFMKNENKADINDIKLAKHDIKSHYITIFNNALGNTMHEMMHGIQLFIIHLESRLLEHCKLYIKRKQHNKNEKKAG